MKTTVLFRMIVLVAMVFAGISNATVKAQNNNFITNEETVGDLVVSKVIYRLDGSLYRHMKYDFTYDDQKRMATKEAFKWDASTDKVFIKGSLPLTKGCRTSRLIILILLMKSLWYTHVGMILTELTMRLLKRACTN